MELLILFIKCIFVLNLIVGLASFCTWIERKGSALIQDRVGANRSGAFIETRIAVLKPIFWALRLLGQLGVINTLINDALKGLLKEDFIPAGVPAFVHALAPFAAVFPVFLAFALVPLAPDFEIAGYLVRCQVAMLDGGVLFVFALASLAVYGVTLAGWTSNNKFSMLGALRAAAQMISYELTMGLCFVAVIAVYGTTDLYRMIQMQQGVWGVLYQPLTCLLLFVVGMAETKRNPFDLPESESELVAGYFTEYSGMKFLLFWMGEFAEIALVSVLLTALFFGGWHLPLVSLPEGTWWAALIGHAVFMGKVVFFCTLQIALRWTLPRFRFDQLMTLGWKILLPLGLANLLICALLKLAAVFPL